MTPLNYKLLPAIFLTMLICACSHKGELLVDYSNAEIEYSGRIDSLNGQGAELFWSGTSVQMNFEGDSLFALLEDESGDNYYNVIIDDSISILRPATTKQYHLLAADLPKGKHSIELFKRNEWDRGATHFYGFKIKGNAKLLSKSPPQKRKIEFYGNSITAGYAIEDFSGRDSPDSSFTNNYLSYAAITARHFDAKYQCICRSGIGITVSWFPMIMPEIYDRLNQKSKWDFSNYEPDVVVVNLFQNDSWIVELPDNEEFKRRFGTKKPTKEFLINAYQEFISKLRSHYPNAHIICSLGCMDATKEGSKWMGYIETAAANLNDEKIYRHFMPYIEATAHPSIEDNEKMAKELIGFIEKEIEW